MELYLLTTPVRETFATHVRDADGTLVRIATITVADTAKVHLGKDTTRLESLDGYTPIPSSAEPTAQ